MVRFQQLICGRRKDEHRASSRLSFERLEDRRMLTKADIVFVVDGSGSEYASQEWLKVLVTGDTDGNGVQDIPSLADRLASQGIDDVRYGLVVYGQYRFAHSYVVDQDPGPSQSVFDRLWSDGTTRAEHASDMRVAIESIAIGGLEEDGWDGIEHALAEYTFRPGAVPVILDFQGEGTRQVRDNTEANQTLTRDGLLATLRSKDVILNTLTVGFDAAGGIFIPMPLFEMSRYGLNSDLRVLGVEPDFRDGQLDGHHSYYSLDTNLANGVQIPAATNAGTLQVSFNGSNTGATGMVASGKSVLIGQGVTGGVGPSAGYSAKSVPFEIVPNMSVGTTNHIPGTAIPGYSFNFYGTTYNQVFVNEDGTITFGPGAALSSGDNVDLSYSIGGQSRPTVPMIAALWDDLSSVSIVRKSVNVDGNGVPDMVIQWTNSVYAGDEPPADAITFQVILFDNGGIQFNYLDIDTYAGDSEFDETVTNTGGISATVGIWRGVASPTDLISVPAGKILPGPQSFTGTGTIRTTVSCVLPGIRVALHGTTASFDSTVSIAWRRLHFEMRSALA